MQVGKTARAIAAAPSFAWPQLELRRWGLRISLFAFCLASAFLLTASRLEITRLGYQLSSLDRQRQSLLADVTRLEVESASLSSPARIKGVAQTMGFVHPDRESVAVLDE